MAKKKEVGAEIKLLKSKVLAGKAVIGTERVLKGLKARNVTISKVFLASNCPQKAKAAVQHYAKLAKVPVVDYLELDNEELGILCKKSFLISVLGIIGE